MCVRVCVFVDGLLLAGQAFSVTSRPLALADDPTLATAMAVALRSGVDSTSGEPTLSLDSDIIHRQISHRCGPQRAAASLALLRLAHKLPTLPALVLIAMPSLPLRAACPPQVATRLSQHPDER